MEGPGVLRLDAFRDGMEPVDEQSGSECVEHLCNAELPADHIGIVEPLANVRSVHQARDNRRLGPNRSQPAHLIRLEEGSVQYIRSLAPDEFVQLDNLCSKGRSRQRLHGHPARPREVGQVMLGSSQRGDREVDTEFAKLRPE